MDVVPIIVHLIGSDLTEEQAERLAALCAGGSPDRPHVVQLGSGRCCAPREVRVLRVHDELWPRWALARVTSPLPGRKTIYHVWTRRALRALPGVPRPGVGMVIDLAPTRSAARGLERVAGPRVYVCRHRAAVRAWGSAGVAADDCVVIPPIVDMDALRGADRVEARRRLGLADDETAIVALPPATRDTRTFQIAWATLVVEKVRPDVRLVLPTWGDDLPRVERLVRDCRHEWIVRKAAGAGGLPHLLAAADLVVALPKPQAPLNNLLAALLAGKSCVVAGTAAVEELLSWGFAAERCADNSPAAISRAMLQALERGTQDERRGLSEAKRFSREDLAEGYRRVHERVAGMIEEAGAVPRGLLTLP